MIIVGIDPGFSGAIAFYSTEREQMVVHDMPIICDPKGRNVLDMKAVYDLLDLSGEKERAYAAVEYVAARPGQGAPATFRFGQGYGAIQMALAAHGLPTQYVTPAKWKGHFGLSKDKGASRGLAKQRFPAISNLFDRVKDDGRAEAVLIAAYALEKLNLA
jgi:crossover junction endodeoxyribonuclease RuvC